MICALAIGQRVVEGVRRLATPSGATLLRAERVPTASGVRKLLGRLIAQTDGGAVLEARMIERLLQIAARDEAAVFFVDNHLRPYSGKHVVRKGWRMQDRRVRPGITDYYVHDEDDRPMFRMPAPSHDHLTDWLLPIGRRLRNALGADETIVLAFDRGGAFPEQLAALRDANFDFITYERKPYAELPTSAFEATTIDGETVGLHERRLTNLGGGRGRIRRIVVRVHEGAERSLGDGVKLRWAARATSVSQTLYAPRADKARGRQVDGQLQHFAAVRARRRTHRIKDQETLRGARSECATGGCHERSIW